MDSLGPGAVKQIRLYLKSKPGIDQRSYSLTVKSKFDSPEFKNADESLSINIPIKQIQRMNMGNVDIMPESIEVGGETNIMFGINNTGKVNLYNVMVRFEADSIQTTDAYVGNIKPGDTGNVDAMVTGAAPTTDDGVIRVTISYEDENGEVTSEQKEMRLYVLEEMEEDLNINAGNFVDTAGEHPSFWNRYRAVIIGLGVILTAAVLTGIFKLYKRRKNKLKWDEDNHDEIS